MMMIERELISAPELEELVKKGIVTKEGSTYIYSGSNLTVMKEMHRDLLSSTRHKILVEEGKTDPFHKDTGWFVPDWIFADRYEELLKNKFDKSKIYTAVNADELKPGDKVLLADSLGFLKKEVTDGSSVLTLGCVLDEDHVKRFVSVSGVKWALAYLIERKDKKEE